MFSWGYGASGCLGHGNFESQIFPKKIKSLEHEIVKYVEAGGYHNVALTEN